ncbi:hypothetical protein [Cohnella terricola]|uniref:Uncharacterized protein n=1 Tax=Cohnella terricola TaxID=1289167 RepID=A0A559J5D9_9BACL|nr:hypothetical protein [Cohnella terricola]TVX95097.1 hypothetical protein FPZ45_24135 [Cohnella terricola]
MEYFFVSHDSRLDSIGGDILFSDRVLNGFDQANEDETAVVKSGKKLVYRSVIEHPVLLVSTEICEILKQFKPDLRYKVVVVTDPLTYENSRYGLIDIPVVDCISRTKSTIEHGIVKLAVIDENLVGDLNIFKISQFPEAGLAVRLDVAEGLLRRSLYGIRIRRIQSQRSGLK